MSGGQFALVVAGTATFIAGLLWLVWKGNSE